MPQKIKREPARRQSIPIDARFKKLDEVFASDAVGDGTTGITGPFEAAQGRFFTGQVIPLVVGAFGEVNEALEKVLKRVAKAAAAETD